MAQAGTLEVLLVGAKGLENTDYLCNMDPYAVLRVTSQEQKSSVAEGKGSDPEWNETFVFTASENATELIIKLLDKDNGTNDDSVGEGSNIVLMGNLWAWSSYIRLMEFVLKYLQFAFRIPLEAVYTEGNIPPTVYNVVKDEEYRGEIRIGLKFTPEENHKSIRNGIIQFSMLMIAFSRRTWKCKMIHLGIKDWS
ncbi:hypothetical protein ACQ4PT_031119 [Festuca glaucescens]